ncbi:hypothetical protein Bca4012_080853 [Brassica carinata]
MGEVGFNPIVLCFFSLESSPRGFSPLCVSALLGAVSVGGSRRRPLLSPLSPQLKSPVMELSIDEDFEALCFNLEIWLQSVNGRVYKLVFGPKAFVVISDPIVARHVFRENAFSYDKGVLSEILEPIMGNLQIMVLGFDDKFIRTWNYYFDYCAAGFKTLTLGNYQGTVILHATREEEQTLSGTLRWHESGKSFKEEHLVSLYSPEY